VSSNPRPDGGGLAVAIPSLPRAACRNTDPDLWIGPDDEAPKTRQRREQLAIAICRTCPERQPCLDFALSQPSQAGVQGGVGEYRRKSLRNAAVRAWTAWSSPSSSLPLRSP
jgi:WhiB family redox-sensing transcriptional regulator